MAEMYINGEWVGSSDGQTTEIINPASGEVVDSVPMATAADAERAVEAARAAFSEWADTEPDKRSQLIRDGIALIKENSDEITRLLTLEQGKPLFEAGGELHHFLHGMEFYAGLASKIRGSQVPLPPALNKNAYGLVLKQPVGIAVGIVPWNFPLTLMGTKIGPSLIAGCPLIIKPATSTPLATLKIIGLLNEAGLPPGVLQCVTGRGSVVGETLVRHPAVRRVALTGSSQTGKRIMEVAGPEFKRITLELGGSDPMIVMPDANIRKAVSGAQIGRFWNAGQACLAVKRLYLHDDIYDEFMEQLLGKVARYEPGEGLTKPEKPKIRMGPLHTAYQRDEIEDQLADAVDRGAEVLIGGTRPDDESLANGHYFNPAVVTNVSMDSKLVTEEVFGPVLPVWRFNELDDALQMANASQWGLGSSIWTSNLAWANRAVREIEAGVTWVNQIHYGYDELPFGGVKASGIGHEHGPEAVDYYLENKGVVFGGLDWE